MLVRLVALKYSDYDEQDFEVLLLLNNISLTSRNRDQLQQPTSHNSKWQSGVYRRQNHTKSMMP